MRSLRVSLLTVFLVGLGALGTSEVHAQWVDYDAFPGASIDPAKWSGLETGGGLASPNTEIHRSILFGKLHEKLVGYGSTAADTGVASHGTGLGVTNPGPVIGLEAKVTVVHAAAGGCIANPAPARARARVVGAFFNDGSSGGPEDRTGDIRAGVQKQLDSVTGARIAAVISRCAGADCTVSADLSSQFFATTWKVLQAHVLRVEWVPQDDKFVFTVNPGALDEEVVELTYLLSASDLPVLDFKSLSLDHTTPNCLADRRKTFMDALYDHARVLLGPVSGPGVCAEYGQLCSQPDECCNAVPCTSGRCVFP